MTIVAVMLVPDPFALDHFVRQFVCVCPFWNGRMGIDGEPDEDSGADHRSPDKNIPGSLLLHRSLLDRVQRARVLNLECLERG